MSRTTRSTRHWPTWLQRWWGEDFRLRCERNQESHCCLDWPVAGGWWTDWDPYVSGSPRSRRWLKRYTAKFRRRQGRRETEQLDNLCR